ncbi:unnamed protein product [Rotaria magnacalcarata]|uniref:Uncharacterized protein n=1 Tax=Rotaria magnacalcarata TaxID=392030 RepID=A0A816SHX8_9BILA|nr:unnamed protein product [Rotaria magnacalcarata]CAF2214081.1 unnamed protein product [Rotaria magnacalcarata]CAF3794892.1 unnamed protein product [Rotaria magnacalcarata]CAF3866771.1 unnamed protein product [Rotaria magnacalcarata]
MIPNNPIRPSNQNKENLPPGPTITVQQHQQTLQQVTTQHQQEIQQLQTVITQHEQQRLTDLIDIVALVINEMIDQI